MLWDQKTQQPLLTQGYSTPILRLRINRDHFLVTLRNGVLLYANPGRADTPPKCLATYKTISNPYGLCCLGKHYMVFLGHSAGQVWVVELPRNGRKGDVGIIPAHEGAIRQLCLSRDEQVIATASEKGTIIRVFSTLTNAKVAEFRRGIDPAIIYGLDFSPSNARLAATGDKGTLHIFELATASSSSRPPSAAASAPAHRRTTSSSSFAASSSPSTYTDDWESVQPATQREQKWGALASVPIAPRIFRDTYSAASAAFDLGDEPALWQAGSIGFSISSYSPLTTPRPEASSASVSSVSSTATEKPARSRTNAAVPGWPGGRPPKGIVGWLSEDEVVVLGGGQSAMWQSFYVQKNQEGKLICWRRGWKKINEP